MRSPVSKSPSQDPASTGVLYYWQIDLAYDDPALAHELIPSPYQDLIFPMRGIIELQYFNDRFERPFLSTLLADPIPLEFSAGMKIFGIRLLPEFATCHTGQMMKDLPFGPIDLSTVFCEQKRAQINDTIHRNTCFDLRCNALDRLMAKWILDAKLPANSANVIYMAQYIRSDATVSISDLYEQLPGSARANNSLFRQLIGTSPKRYQQLVRFNKALMIAREQQRLGLAQIAGEAGYSDQAHFTRTCQRYAGTSPGKLKRSDWLSAHFNHT